MAIIQAGQQGQQIVPQFNVVLQPPGVLLTGAPTNTLGVVGTAAWGPVNTPVAFGGTADGGASFGPVTNRAFDMMTHVMVAGQQGCQAFIGVRVTDGTDTAAFGGVYAGTPSTGQAIITSRNTGSAGAGSFTISQGLNGTYTFSFTAPALNRTETFSGIAAGANVAATYANIAAAVNANSLLVTFTPQAAAALPTLPYAGTISGGTDGAGNLTPAMLVGQDGLSRTGMYALRGQPVSVLDLVDMTDWTQASVVAALAQSLGWYAPIGGPAGQSVSAAQTAASAAGYGVKLLLGDWLWWYDQVNNLPRLVNPAAFAAGLIATQDPNQSSLNKPLVGIIGSQRAGMASSGQTATYSLAEKQALFLAGVDLIANPSPGGAYWSVQRGCNASGSGATNGDNYTRMTGYLGNTLGGAGGMGQYVGQPVTPTLFQNITASLLGLLSSMVQKGWLVAGSYSVQCNAANNPQAQVSQGIVRADVQTQYEPITLFLNVNLAAGQTVVPQTTTGA